MYKALELITIIKEKNKRTSYLYNKSDKILLPIDISNNKYYPHTTDTLIRVIRTFKAEIKCIKIYLLKEHKYYAYLSIYRKQKIFDINISLHDALIVAIKHKKPIFIKAAILYKQGIFITKEMIQKALENNCDN